MSGIHFVSPVHAGASAVATVPDHAHGAARTTRATPAAARTTRATPAASVLLSGGVHAALLALFLVLTAHAPEAEIPTMAIRAHPMPFETYNPVPPAISRGGPQTPDGPGQIVPKEDGPDIPTAKPTDKPYIDGPVGRGSMGEPGRNRLPEVPGAIPDQPRPDPSIVVPYDEPPVPIYHPDPIYPGIAREAGVEGLVQLEAIVTSEGAVREVKVLDGNVMLASEARKAVLTWKFRPGKRKGVAVTTRVAIPVRFTLRG